MNLYLQLVLIMFLPGAMSDPQLDELFLIFTHLDPNI